MGKPERGVRQRLEDIVEQIGIVEEVLRRSSLSDAITDVVYRSAIERCIAVISEAARHLPTSILTGAPDIPWMKIRGIGNILRHDYERIDPDIVHDIVLYELGALGEACREALASLD